MRQLLHLMLFTSLFISSCTTLMTWQTFVYLNSPVHAPLLYTVFFATLLSYNIHWYFTTDMSHETIRIRWTLRHRTLHLALAAVAAAGLLLFLFKSPELILPVLPASVATFLYTAPKLPSPLLRQINQWRIGKTIYLTLVWVYVTACLPSFFIEDLQIVDFLIFTINRFSLIYAICILFDYKDLSYDMEEGIRNIFTNYGMKGAFRLFYICIMLGVLTAMCWYMLHRSISEAIYLAIPVLCTLGSVRSTLKGRNDYFYYGWLDGLMMLSAVLVILEKIFLHLNIN